MKQPFLILLLLLSPLTLWGQIQLRGTLRSCGDEEIDGFSITIRAVSDSLWTHGEYFLDSSFTLQVTPPCYLLFQSLGFENRELLIDSTTAQELRVCLDPKFEQIESVQVVGQRKLIRSSRGGVSFNVSASSILRESGTIIDLLSQIPRVRVNADGSVEILGLGQALVYIDGRKIQNSQQLLSLDSRNVENIEVLTDPPAKYAASGRAVIEITTKRVNRNGVGGSAWVRAVKEHFAYGQGGVDITTRFGSWDAYAYYAYTPTRDAYWKSYHLEYDQGAERRDIDLRTDEMLPHSRNTHYVRMNLEHHAPWLKGLNLGAQGVFNFRGKSGETTSNMEMHTHQAQELLESWEEVSGNSTRGFSLQGGAFAKYDAKPFGLETTYDIYRSKSHAHMNKPDQVAIQESFPESLLQNVRLNGYVLLPFHTTLSLGAEFETFNSTTRTEGEEYQGGQTAGTFRYEEQNLGLYGELDFHHKELGLRAWAGLRAEAYYMLGELNSQPARSTPWTWGWFPSLGIKWDFATNWEVRLTGNRRISRPSLWELDPTPKYHTPMSYFVGNEHLRPQINYKGSLKLTFMRYASLELSYTRRQQMFGWYIGQRTDELIEIQKRNIDHNTVWALDAVLPYQWSWLTVYLAPGVWLTDAQDLYSGLQSVRKTMWYLAGGLTFNFPHNWTLETNANYNSETLYNIFYIAPQFRHNASLKKNFPNMGLSIGLYLYDIWRTGGTGTYADLGPRYIRHDYYDDTQSFRLQVIWNFFHGQKEIKMKGNINTQRAALN